MAGACFNPTCEHIWTPCWDNGKVSCWNTYWTRDHDSVVHDSLWCYSYHFTLVLHKLLLSSVHPNLKQWQLRKSSPIIKGLVIPLHTINLCAKLQGPIWKLTIIDPFTPTSWPFAVLIQVLLSEIWCKSSNSATVSYLMQLTCAPVSKRGRKGKSFILILKVVPFVLPVFITNTSFSTVLLLTSSVLLSMTSQADEFPEFSVDSLLSSIAAALSIWSSVTQKAWIKLFSVISFTCLLLLLCSLSLSHLSFIARSNFLKKSLLNCAGT